MVTLKEEEAFAFAPHEEYLSFVCSFCFDDKNRVFKCSACHTVSYCRKDCQKSDWIDHKNECRLLQNWNKYYADHFFLPSAHVRIASRILLMSEERRSKAAFNGRTWDSIVFKNKEMETVACYSNLSMGVENLKKYFDPIRNISLEELTNVLGKVQKAAFNVFDKPTSMKMLGACVYLGLSVNRRISCPSDAYWFNEGTKCVFRAFDAKTVYSPELIVSSVATTPFTEPHLFRQMFRKMNFTNCKCPVCSDENHIINRMGESCHVSCCEDGAGILNENSSEPYRCNKCGKASTITKKQVEDLQSLLDEHIEENEKILSNIFETSEGILNHLPSDAPIKFAAAETILDMGKLILSVFNYRILDLHKQIIKWAVLNDKRLALELQEALIPAFQYYFHEAHPSRANLLIDMATIKQSLGMPDAAAATYKAYTACVLAFGENHEITKDVKKQFDLFQVMEQMKKM